METDLWTMAELADRVTEALSSGYAGQPNRRVSDVPDARAIRYYTTLGLLDRPAEMRGRTAFYSARHLWQLIAIKRLQAGGHTLAEIQQQLAGATDRSLRQLAAVPDNDFWRSTPGPTPPPPPHASSAAAAPAPATLYQAVTLDDGVIVLLPRRDPLSDHDIATLRNAAAPLHRAIHRLAR